MKTKLISVKKLGFLGLLQFGALLSAQTNVFDDVIVPSPNHTYLEAALIQENLDDDLQTLTDVTVFAPTDAAFTNLATALGTDINGLLMRPDLSDILLYHVLGSRVDAATVTNGGTPQPLNLANTIKTTKTSGGMVYANQAMVTTADLPADNGFVHVTDAVILPNETVVDVALDNGFTSLATAVITAELLPALTDPLATLTVFAPDNAAFDALATALGTDINGILSRPDLADILTYHVLGTQENAAAINNGDTPTPLNNANTIKMTKTSGGSVYANQAMVTLADVPADNGVVHAVNAVILPNETVVDVALDNGFTSLATAVITAELLPALTDPLANLTVFAPDNAAFDALATALGTDINGILARPDLADILTYHVLGTQENAAAINNGDTPTPLNNANTIKMTKTSGGSVYANQAMVTLADVPADNGVVHAVNAVILPNETVVDVALDNGFTSLATAVITAELLPALTDPLATLTVFAPDNAAFDALATALGTDINGILARPDLADILTYHVLGTQENAAAINNGDTPTPLNNANTIKMTKTSGGSVYANQAMVTLADVAADNGVVHAVNAVILPSETVVDAALDNGFSTLATAVITAELLPALTDPLANLTVFAPDNAAFDALATALGTDINGILARPDLADILTYHVLGMEYLAADLNNTDYTALSGGTLTVDLSNGAMVNDANITLTDVDVDNGVVHAIDKVLLDNTSTGIADLEEVILNTYPNPTSGVLNIEVEAANYVVYNIQGAVVATGTVDNQKIDISELNKGTYLLQVYNKEIQFNTQIIKE